MASRKAGRGNYLMIFQRLILLMLPYAEFFLGIFRNQNGLADFFCYQYSKYASVININNTKMLRSNRKKELKLFQSTVYTVSLQ